MKSHEQKNIVVDKLHTLKTFKICAFFGQIVSSMTDAAAMDRFTCIMYKSQNNKDTPYCSVVLTELIRKKEKEKRKRKILQKK